MVIILLAIILIIIVIGYNQQENAESTTASAVYSVEAVQNIAKVYADTSGTATFNNINSTGTINASNINTTGNIIGLLTSPNKKFQISMQDNGDMGIYDVDNKKNVWAAGKNGIFTDTNFVDNVSMNKNLTINGKLTIGDQGMRIWKQGVWNGTLLTDGVNSYFSTDKWVVIAVGGRFTGGNATAPFTYIADGKWYGSAYAGYNTTFMAIPINFFSYVATSMNQL